MDGECKKGMKVSGKRGLSMKGRMHLATESAHGEVEQYKKKQKSKRKRAYKR